MFKHFEYFLSTLVFGILFGYLDIRVFLKLRRYLNIEISLVLSG